MLTCTKNICRGELLGTKYSTADCTTLAYRKTYQKKNIKVEEKN